MLAERVELVLQLAQGLSNRDIAQALFVSTKTVEWQLSRAYEKLAIHSRARLPGALSSSD